MELIPGNSLITSTPEEGRALALALARHSIHAMQPNMAQSRSAEVQRESGLADCRLAGRRPGVCDDRGREQLLATAARPSGFANKPPRD